MRCALSLATALLLTIAATSSAQSGMQAAQRQPAAVRSVLTGDATIAGRVTDAESKRPVEVAFLQLTSADLRSLVTQADSDGFYTFERIAAASYRIGVTHDGYVEQVYAGDATVALAGPNGASSGTVATSTLQVDADARRTIDFGLVRAASVRGRITRDDGRPLPGASMYLNAITSGAFASRSFHSWMARATERGDYVIVQVPPGDYNVAVDWSDRVGNLRPRVDVARDGAFAMDGLFGERVLRVVGFTDGWSVDQVLLGKTPVTSLTLDPAASVENVRIVLTRKRQQYRHVSIDDACRHRSGA
jgi:hypothetical protein